MFIGHYGPALWDAQRADGIKLWHAFIAVQAMDLVFCMLAIAGVEGGQNPHSDHPLAFNVPFSHSLTGAIIIAIAAALFYRVLRPNTGRRGACLIGALAFSHWPLDWLVHRPDLPVYPGSDILLGLGLWDFPWATFALEVFLLGMVMAWWITGTRGPRWTTAASAVFVMFLSAVQFAMITTPTLAVQAGTFDPLAGPGRVQFGITGLIAFAGIAAIMAMLEHYRRPKTAP